MEESWRAAAAAASVEPACLAQAPSRGRGRRPAPGAAAAASLLFSPPPLQAKASSAGASPSRASGPGARPRPLGTKTTGPPPTARSGPPHGYRRTRLAPPERLGGVFKVPAAGNGDRGAPGGRSLDNSFLPNVVSEPRLCIEIQKEQLLAVDHSAHASMKNAASCEK